MVSARKPIAELLPLGELVVGHLDFVFLETQKCIKIPLVFNYSYRLILPHYAMTLEKPLWDRFVIPQQRVLTQKTDFHKLKHFTLPVDITYNWLCCILQGMEEKVSYTWHRTSWKQGGLREGAHEKCLPSELNMGCLGRKVDMWLCLEPGQPLLSFLPEQLEIIYILGHM